MHSREYIDLGRIMDRIFQAAENMTDMFGEFDFEGKKRGEQRDFYSVYPFPPVNSYMTADKTLVFEFALAGYQDSDISLEFQGDSMVLNANAPAATCPDGEVMYFNRRLKYKTIVDQKYLVPEDKFDRDNAKAVFKNGILRVTIPPREVVKSATGTRIHIVNED